MYKEFYNLKENPFKLAPSLEYFFVTVCIKNLLKLLQYGLEQNVGFMMLTGEVGVGKTSFLRYFFSQLDKTTVERAYLFNPTFSRAEELLQFLLLDLKIISEVRPNETKVSLLQKLYNYLLKQHEEGKKSCLSWMMLKQLQILS